jgi:hypothetical protein
LSSAKAVDKPNSARLIESAADNPSTDVVFTDHSLG